MKRPESKHEDRVNLRILECLAKHGRMPYAQMAETLKLTANAVRDRILSMERRGVIRSYHAVISPDAVQHPVHVLALMEPAPGRSDALPSLSNHPNILSISECSGRYGLVLEMRAPSLDDIHEILRESLYEHGYELAEFISLGAPLSKAAKSRSPSQPTNDVAVAE
jgi:DNA-binding Lrp family transcriptional regulator